MSTLKQGLFKMIRTWHCSNSLSGTCLWNYRVLANRWKKVKWKSHQSWEVKVHHMPILIIRWSIEIITFDSELSGIIRHLEVEHFCRNNFIPIFDWSVGHNKYINFNIKSCFFAYYPNKVWKYWKIFFSSRIECNINANIINQQNSTEPISRYE